RAVRNNILCNPTGKEGAWRALDWLVEHNNLYTKRIYGGQYSNRTIDRMIKLSPLIEIHKKIRIQFEKMFCLLHKTTRHSPPKMEKTFEKLLKYMLDHKATEFKAGRKTAFEINDMMSHGFSVVQLGKFAPDVDSMDEEAQEPEVVDDGSLDV
ncbi:hypothetical protein BKA70DRAFT_1118495, partial [Coprinopsis sp. MPI-PUGE-AT-0042]